MLRNKLGYVLFLVAAGFFAVLYNEYFIGIIFLVAVLLPLILLIIAVYCSFKVIVKLDSTTKTAGKHEHLNLTVNLKNTSVFPISRMNILIEYYNEFSGERNKENIQVTIDQKSSQNVSCQINSKYSGNLFFKVKSLTLYDYFHIWSIKRKSNQENHVIVLPETYEIPVDIIKENQFIILDSDIYSETRPGDDPSEVFGIREYREGDKPNRIHRKLSIKQNHLMIKEFSEPVKEAITVLFDQNCGEKYEKRLRTVDGLLDCAMSVFYNLFLNEHKFKLVWCENEKDTDTEFPVHTEAECLAAMERLLKLQFPAKGPTILAEQNLNRDKSKQTHLIYITSGVREEEITEWADNHRETFFTLLYVNYLDKNPVNENLKAVLQDLNIILYEIDINNIKDAIVSIGSNVSGNYETI